MRTRQSSAREMHWAGEPTFQEHAPRGSYESTPFQATWQQNIQPHQRMPLGLHLLRREAKPGDGLVSLGSPPAIPLGKVLQGTRSKLRATMDVRCTRGVRRPQNDMGPQKR